MDYYKSRLKGLLILLIQFWVILVLFTCVSCTVGNSDVMPGSVLQFLKNFFLLENSYNGAWWYLFSYAIIVVASPWLLKLTQKHCIVVLLVSALIYVSAFYVRFYSGSSLWIALKYGPLGMTLSEYILGAIAAQEEILSKLYKQWSKLSMICQRILTCVIVLVLLYARSKIIPNLIVAPVSGFVLMVLFHYWKKPLVVRSFFEFMGTHSTNIWLTHMFFFSTLFVNFVYIAKYPILIYGLLLLNTVTLSIVLKKVQEPICELVLRRIKR